MHEIKSNKIISSDKGFTLVELLVGVVILSIAAVGIIQALTTAGITNALAQKKQNATSLAESVMEEIKSSSLTQMTQIYNSGTAIALPDPESVFFAPTASAKDRAATASGLISGNGGLLSYETSKPFYYVLCKTGAYATTPDDLYTVTATMRTSPYNQTASGATPIPDASDANTIKLPIIEEIDAHTKTVLSMKEINKFDVAAQEYFRMHSGFGSLAIKTKEIIINKSGNGEAGASGKIDVKCTIRYTATDDTTTYIKEVFNGTYISQTEGGAAQPVNNGIYIFYNRFLASGEQIIVNDSSTNDDHKVYVIFQKKVKKGPSGGLVDDGDINNLSGTEIKITNGSETAGNFFTVTSNVDLSYTKADGDAGVGRKKATLGSGSSAADYWLITNLPGSAGPGAVGDFSERSSKNRVFEVTVEVTKDKPGDDTVYATLTSTVDVRE